MANIIRKQLKNFLINHNIRVSRPCDASMLATFFSLIKPVKTNIELVRIGGESDGGYLVPDDFSGIDTCFSPGVSNIAHFELECAKRGIKCFLADYSVEQPPVMHKLFDFEKRYLGANNDAINITLDSWLEQKGYTSRNAILQMDIEGAEYETLLEASHETLDRFRMMAIEFHSLDGLLDTTGFKLIYLTFAKILKHFEIVHMHPNNFFEPVPYLNYQIPPVIEFTFLRKDRITSKKPLKEFPHHLDRKNIIDKKDFPLPACWYSS